MATVSHSTTSAWKQRLGGGVVAWVALGVGSALLDSHGGVIALCGGFLPWIATGVGLGLAYAAGRGVHQRAGAIAGVLAAIALLAGAVVLVASIDWQTVSQSLVALVGMIGAFVVVLFGKPGLGSNVQDSQDAPICGWRNDGPFGPGYYAGDLPLEDDD